MAKLVDAKNIIHVNKHTVEVQTFSADSSENELVEELKRFFSEFTNYDATTNTINGEDVDRLIECVLNDGCYNYADNCYIYVVDCMPGQNLHGKGQIAIY